MTRWLLVLVGLTLIGLLLRLWGIGFGLPYSYHIDEHFYYPFAWAMGQGQLNLPDQSHGPSLYLALLLVGQQIAHALLFSHLSNAEFGALIDSNPWPYMLSARIVSALAGALTIPVVYGLGKRYHDRTVAVIAAALMTVLFFHVRDSHFGVPDSLTTLFATAAVWLALRAFQTNRFVDLGLAGLFAGLATGAKYTSVFAFVPVILAALLSHPTAIRPRRWRVAAIAIAFAGLMIGFVIAYPNIFINSAAFVKDISFLSARVGEGYEGWRIVPDNSTVFYLATLAWGIGIAALILVVLGFLAALTHRTANDWILIAFPIIYFIVISLSQGHFGRYMLPILPCLVVLVAEAGWHVLPDLIRRLRHPIFVKIARPIGVIALLVVFIPNLANSLRLDWLLTQPDTRTVAKQWIETNVAAGTRIAVEWPYHTPPLSNGYEVPPNSQREYWIDRVWGFGLADRPLEQYQTDGTQLIIGTSYIRDIPVLDARQEAQRQAFYARLPQVFRTIKTFSPRCDGGDPAFIFDQLYGPAIDLWNLCESGPQIDIYQVHSP